MSSRDASVSQGQLERVPGQTATFPVSLTVRGLLPDPGPCSPGSSLAARGSRNAGQPCGSPTRCWRPAGTGACVQCASRTLFTGELPRAPWFLGPCILHLRLCLCPSESQPPPVLPSLFLPGSCSGGRGRCPSPPPPESPEPPWPGPPGPPAVRLGPRTRPGVVDEPRELHRGSCLWRFTVF